MPSNETKKRRIPNGRGVSSCFSYEDDENGRSTSHNSPLFQQQDHNYRPSPLHQQSALSPIAGECDDIQSLHSETEYLMHTERNNKQHCTESLKDMIGRYISSYETFIRDNRHPLQFMESILSRTILYSQPSREESGRSETCYAILNLWILLNDCIYYGYGTGSEGMTGIESHGSRSMETHQTSTRTSVISHQSLGQRAVFMCRMTLSIIECIEPSLEVSSYYSGEQTSISYGHKRAVRVSRTIERIKFFLRLVILSVRYSKTIRDCITQGSSDTTGDTVQDCLRRVSAGILQDGGALEPGHTNVESFEDEQFRIQKLLYRGKRTGKRLQQSQNTRRGQSYTDFCSSPRVKLGFLMMGELLHIYRPLYWVHQCHEQAMASGDFGNEDRSRKLKELKAWLISLLMDVLSHKLTTMSMTSRTTRLAATDQEDISSHSTKEELRRRKLRWTLYLLRAPIWELFTQRTANGISKVVGTLVPFLGAPCATYIMDLLDYWRRWHFMLE